MSAAQSKISIVMAYLNGATFLPDQLASVLAQDYPHWHLIACDDGSKDNSTELIANTLCEKRRTLLQGPRQGFAQNFLFGLTHVPAGQFAAFCDQDDYWYPNKLRRALTHLCAVNGPALYYASRDVADVDLTITNTQPCRPYRGFAHALFRNFASGHTLVLNPAAVSLAQTHMPQHPVPFHDWWCALLISGAGGRIIRDSHPVLAYRQHSGNVLGASGGRMRTLLNGRYLTWLHRNFRALHEQRTALSQSLYGATIASNRVVE